MNKFENVYQDAALMRKVLLGEANEVEQQDLEKRLAECPDLQKVYGQLQNGETLRVAFGEYQNYSIFSSENRADGAESTEASFSPGLVVGCCGCRYFSRRSFFLHVELYLTGRRGKSLDSAGNSTGTTDFARWQRD